MSKTLKIVLAVLNSLALLFWAGFIIWSLSGHGSTEMLRVTRILLYVLLSIVAARLVFTGLFIRYWVNLHKGREQKKLTVFLFIVSIISIAVLTFGFIQLGILPPSKDMGPAAQLDIAGSGETGLHFAVGSDAHFGAGTNNPGFTADMLGQIGDPENKFDAFFFLGDMVEYGFNDGQWEEAFNAFSDTAESVPVRILPGNHDTIFGGLSRYLAYCAPDIVDGQETSRLWSRIDTGNVHFLLLDVEWSAEAITAEQIVWLEEQLESIPDEDWKIVMSHGFYYASGITVMGWNWYDNPETIARLVPVFEKYGVDIVFSGHNHCMELLQHSGVTYAVCGAFGGRPDPDRTYISPYGVWFTHGQAGFADVRLNNEEATISFRGLDSNVLKSFTITKE